MGGGGEALKREGELNKFHATFHIALFMHKFHNKLLPSYFDTFFNSVLNIHNYNTRSAVNQFYYFNIRF